MTHNLMKPWFIYTYALVNICPFNTDASPQTNLLTLRLRRFCLLPFNWYSDNFYIPSPGTEFFLHVYCLAQTFFLVLMFPGLRIEKSGNRLPASKGLITRSSLLCEGALSTVQGKCIYTIFKVENQETQFSLLCTKPSIDKHMFSSFQQW